MTEPLWKSPTPAAVPPAFAGRARRKSPEHDLGDESYTRALTRRRRELLAAGIHPTTKRPLLPDEPDRPTCSSCASCFGYTAARTYYKCERAAGGLTHGPASDVRLSWPACDRYELKVGP